MENYIINTATFQLTEYDFIIRLLVSLGIGFVIGLEREHAAFKEKIESFTGLRTFILIVLMGFVGGLTYYLFSPLLFILIFLSVVLLTSISYYVTASKGDIGTTTEFSALIGFFLGVLTLLGMLNISIIITVVVVILLSTKLRLHSIAGKITTTELYDFILFIVIALLVFPFLPDKTYGPYNVINPHEIGWVIILISGLGFIGYILMKFLGAKKGILWSGIIGGLVSSTAVTWVFSKKSKENESLSQNCAIAILAASSIMIIRILVLTFIFNKALFNTIYPSILLVLISGIVVTLYFYFKQKGVNITDTTIPNNKPLDIQGALVFGAIYTAILLVVSYANENMGDEGLMISSTIAGLSDIDAITITVSKLAGHPLNISLAANALLIATISNTLVKMGIGIWAGSPSLRRHLFIGYGVILFTALVALFFIDK